MESWHVTRDAQYVGVMYTKEGTYGASVAGASEMNTETGEWFLNRVSVRPEHRRKGIGSELLRKLKHALDGTTCKKLIVTPGGYGTPLNVLLAFYEKNGFAVVRDYPELEMVWQRTRSQK